MIPAYVQTICDGCGVVVEFSTQLLATPSAKVPYQGYICAFCGNVIIFDGAIVRIAVGFDKQPKGHRQSGPRKWKIINKGKLKIDAT